MSDIVAGIKSLESSLDNHGKYNSVKIPVKIPLGRPDLEIVIYESGWRGWRNPSNSDVALDQFVKLKVQDPDLDRYCPGWEKEAVRSLVKEINYWDKMLREENAKTQAKRDREYELSKREGDLRRKASDEEQLRTDKAKDEMKRMFGK